MKEKGLRASDRGTKYLDDGADERVGRHLWRLRDARAVGLDGVVPPADDLLVLLIVAVMLGQRGVGLVGGSGIRGVERVEVEAVVGRLRQQALLHLVQVRTALHLRAGLATRDHAYALAPICKF